MGPSMAFWCADAAPPAPGSPYSPDEPREFLMGSTADPWRAAETWIPSLASHSVPLHAAAGLSAHPDLAHLATEPSICDRNNRSWRSRTAIRRASCSRPGLDRASCRVRVTKVRDGIPCRLIEPSHRLPPYRSSYRTDRRAVHGRCVPIPPWPTTLGAGNWSMAARRFSPYRSRASPRRKLPAFTSFARPRLSRTRPKPSGRTTRLP
jgi:hypothetical protein